MTLGVAVIIIPSQVRLMPREREVGGGVDHFIVQTARDGGPL